MPLTFCSFELWWILSMRVRIDGILPMPLTLCSLVSGILYRTTEIDHSASLFSSRPFLGLGFFLASCSIFCCCCWISSVVHIQVSWQNRGNSTFPTRCPQIYLLGFRIVDIGKTDWSPSIYFILLKLRSLSGEIFVSGKRFDRKISSDWI